MPAKEVIDLKRRLIDDPELIAGVASYMTLETLDQTGGVQAFGSPREYAAKAVALGISHRESLRQALELSGDDWPGHGAVAPIEVAAAADRVAEMMSMRGHDG
jgi:hypothetical protein